LGPYDDFRSNITAKALAKLAARRNLEKIVFPARFDKSQFIRALMKHDPDIVLGLGQCARGARFRIECRAVNRKRARQATKATPIDVGGPSLLKTTLPLTAGREAGRSRDAGSYVCNFSMYVLLDYIREKRLSTRFGFIHVPFNFRVRKVTNYLKTILDRLACC
jgi:pyroglutamyl-peptidase